MRSNLRKFSKDEVAQKRVRIMEFYDRYGEQATTMTEAIRYVDRLGEKK